MSLSSKYRPNAFDQFVGNRNQIEAVQIVLKKEDRPQAFLITGPSGIGKTTLGRIVASSIGSDGFNFVEMNSADFTGIDSVRDIIRQAPKAGIGGMEKVYLWDEVHQASKSAGEAMLKMLEEPPKHVTHILCTTEEAKISVTIKRRCFHVKLQALDDDTMREYIKSIASFEQTMIPPKVVTQIVQDSQGSPGIAISIVESIIGLPKDQMIEVAKRSAQRENLVLSLCQSLFKKTSWKDVAPILTELKGDDVEGVRWAVMGYASKVCLGGGPQKDRAWVVLDAFKEPFYNSGFNGIVHACYSVLVAD
jgi:DNA polymerase III gamma/tau subunit